MDRNHARSLRARALGAGLAAVVVAAGVVVGAATAQAQVSSARYDASTAATIADIQAFWSATMPAVYGQAYDPIPAERITSYSAENPPPSCDDGGRTTSSYEDVKDNAFYCANGDFVAYDEHGLLDPLRARFGDFAVGLVFAHEWGHAIQARVGYQPSASIYLESQADCFAGAWAQHVASSTDAAVHLAPADLDSALAGMLTLSDPSGVDGAQDGAHGDGFDRVSAFQDGYQGGAQACAAYQDHPPTITEAGYTSSGDQADGGNLSLDDMTSAVTQSLQDYWPSVEHVSSAPAVSAAAGPCGGTTDGGVLADAVTYCPATNTIAYDRTALQTAHDQIGDFAAGTLLATEWASAVQHQLGRDVTTPAARTTSLCLAGAWVGSVSGADGGATSLSPGDLDEAVRELLVSSGGDRGTGFARVAAFRSGFRNGPDTCLGG